MLMSARAVIRVEVIHIALIRLVPIPVSVTLDMEERTDLQLVKVNIIYL